MRPTQSDGRRLGYVMLASHVMRDFDKDHQWALAYSQALRGFVPLEVRYDVMTDCYMQLYLDVLGNTFDVVPSGGVIPKYTMWFEKHNDRHVIYEIEPVYTARFRKQADETIC